MIEALRRRWPDTTPPAPFVPPAPEVRARPADPTRTRIVVAKNRAMVESVEVPRAAVRLARKAEQHGWQAFTWYARGPLLSANGERVLRIVDSCRVEMHRGDQKMDATWLDGQYHNAYCLSGRVINSKALNALVSTTRTEEVAS